MQDSRLNEEATALLAACGLAAPPDRLPLLTAGLITVRTASSSVFERAPDTAEPASRFVPPAAR
jgi:hypothetical protein